MKFSELFDKEDPAYEVFNLALESVFDKGDGNTEHIDRLSKEARLVYLLWSFDGEIHNGGFDQLFVNSLGNYCLEILDGLSAIGSNNSLTLLKQAIAWFPGSTSPQDREERWQQYEKFSEKEEYHFQIESLDQEFYEYKDNLALLINEYVKSNPNAEVRA